MDEKPDPLSIKLIDHIRALSEERIRLLEEVDQRVNEKIDGNKKILEEVIRRLEAQLADHKELLQAETRALSTALTIAREVLEGRLSGLNELRKEVEKDRQQFVKLDVYTPAHEALRVQRVSDNEKAITLAGQVQSNSTEIARMQSSLMWLTRLIVGALIAAVIAWAFQRISR